MKLEKLTPLSNDMMKSLLGGSTQPVPIIVSGGSTTTGPGTYCLDPSTSNTCLGYDSDEFVNGSYQYYGVKTISDICS
jgi:hypothetical protein